MYRDLATIEGYFIKESKNRFLCEVLINGNIEECYVPSSSKIAHYLNLNNKKVLLTSNTGKNVRTKYSLFAVKYYNRYIMLNLNKVNELLSHYISQYEYSDSQVYTINREGIIDGYKSDLVIRELSDVQDKIIEAKGIIDIKKTTYFPKVPSERAIKQLESIKSLLDNKYHVEYYFVSLSPIVQRVILNNMESRFFDLFSECISKGLVIKGISIGIDQNKKLTYRKMQIEI